MFNRTIIAELRIWADKPDRKPLILRGARQVGKTTAVDMFSREFENYIRLNLELKNDLELFQQNLDLKDLIDYILLKKNITLKPGRTLIFIDEIQNSPEAISLLRFFHETAHQFYVIAAGSLLEIIMAKHEISFPVGRVEYRFMYPLTFQEFLGAMDQHEVLKYYSIIPCPDIAVKRIQELFMQYTMIGGMPEIINTYITNQTISGLSILYQSLMTSFQDDVKKYARRSEAIAIIRHAIESAPLEAGNRIKFQGFGKSNYRSREMGEALRNLQRAMLIYLVYPVTSEKPPALPDKKKSPRLQFLDTGLLNFAAGLQAMFYEKEDLHSIYQGKLAEHITAQEIIASDLQSQSICHFWVKEKKQSNAEVDFIIQYREKFIPVEVKAGSTGTLRSLHQFMDRVDHNYAVRLYSGELRIESTRTTEGKKFTLLNLPYCFAGKLNEYIDWFIGNIQSQ
ncbi:MAG TPA: AAA family ATPase [Spirochaetota bacterium]|nr:AAA family ATPase [Spirochaetota bacterium]